MAIGSLIDKALLSAFWGSASEKIDARIAAVKASAATESTAGLVKPGSGLAVASDGTLSAKVDDSTIGFNESGQLTALGASGNDLQLAINPERPLQLSNGAIFTPLCVGIFLINVRESAVDMLVLCSTNTSGNNMGYSLEKPSAKTWLLNYNYKISSHLTDTVPTQYGIGSVKISSTAFEPYGDGIRVFSNISSSNTRMPFFIWPHTISFY